MAGKLRLLFRLASDWIYNVHANLRDKPWFMRRPNYTGPIEEGMRFTLPPWGPQNSIEITSMGFDTATVDPYIYWNRVGWPKEYTTASRESDLREMIGSHGKPERQ